MLPYFFTERKGFAMAENLDLGPLGGRSRREFQERTHRFRVFMDRLAGTVETKREVNRVTELVRVELRRRVRAKQRRERENSNIQH